MDLSQVIPISGYRRHVEREIARQCIADLLEAGYTITVNDGEEDVVVVSSDPEVVLAAMFSTDENWFYVDHPERRSAPSASFVRFIYGNDG